MAQKKIPANRESAIIRAVMKKSNLDAGDFNSYY